MKIGLLILFFLITGCSFSKTPKGNQSNIPHVKVTTFKLDKNQLKILELINSNDLSYIKNELVDVVPGFNFSDSTGKTPADILISLDDRQKIDLFLKKGLSIYESSEDNLSNLLLSRQNQIEKELNKFSIEATVSEKNNYSEELHFSNTSEIINLISKGEIQKANALVTKLKMNCKMATTVLLMEGIVATPPTSKNIRTFIEKFGCTDNLPENEVQTLLKLEVQHQFQHGFESLEIIGLIQTFKNKRMNSFNLENSNIKVSLQLLMAVASYCPFNIERARHTELGRMEYDINEACLTPGQDPPKYTNFGDCEYSNNICLETRYGIRPEQFDFVLSNEGERLLALKIPFTMNFSSKLYGQILAYMYGFNKSRKYWSDSISFISTPKFESYDQ
ncbi:hypothetical protein DOM22_01775 [Bdellovibrio sp. ZAP7]|uniref:hypothetical protein n=1 Tax=Bdellovibrio sp. ZAP7 TaxID=2231053 RepID=UPI00115BBD03|nr:hypothetical protein [Bdellovibrio sp. ZAP7]QDK43977.1 hypothetical protein DOM22_01775 [Bdellovibrio sp. ZAP7]